jgi:hypothetical protein
MQYDLGHINLEQQTLQLGYGLTPMCPGRTQGKVVASEGLEPPTKGL